MDDATSKRWDFLLKVIGLLALISSGLWTLVKFREDRRVDLDHQNQQLNSFVFQQQTSLFFEVSRAAATLATSSDQAKLSEARQRFNELYFGQLVLVEDRRVELAMIAFASCLNGDATCVRPTTNQHNQPLPLKQADITIANFSLELSACMRRALEEDRRISFGNIAPAGTTCPYD